MSSTPQEVFMRTTIIAIGLLASTALVSAASAQTANSNSTSSPPAASSATTSTTNNKAFSEQWRASKMMGLDVYNDQNEKLGDISELLLDKTGKVDGVIIGVGGFLGVGTRDIKVSMDKLKFVDEPVRTSSSTRAPGAASGSSAPTTTASNTNSTMSDARSSSASSTSSSTSKQWYPDHAVMSGASKEQLKSMPEFKYD
jgi:sporulation protein YlmC with PRC-barrel domain